MHFSKLFILLTLSVLATISVCFAKNDPKKESEKEVKVEAEDDSAASVSTDSKASKDSSFANAFADLGSEGSSDLDIGKLLEIIEALKNQNFDDVDKVLKNSPLEKGAPEEAAELLKESNEDETDEEKKDKKDEKNKNDKKNDKKDDKKNDKKDDKKNNKKDDKKNNKKDDKKDEKKNKKDSSVIDENEKVEL